MSKLISSKRGAISIDECSSPEFYEQHGFAFIENAVPEEHLNLYEKKWLEDNSHKPNFAGWQDDKCYMTIDEIKDVLCSEKINDFFFSVDIGVALHVAKTDWAPSFKTWHIDAAHTHEIGPKNYVGSYVAIEDTKPESGPIQIISGSHKWDLDYKSVFSNPSGMFKHDDLEQKRIDMDSEVFTILPSRGDAVVWHGRAVHRGTEAIDNTAPRKGVVAHYCNRLVAEDYVKNAGGHVPAELITKQFISNESGDDDHFFAQWRTGGYYYPDCTITRSWLKHAHPEIENATSITWDELREKIDVSARGDMAYLKAGYDPEYNSEKSA
jgi:hypothetical protein